MNKWKRRYLKLAGRGVWERCYYPDGRLAYWKVVPVTPEQVAEWKPDTTTTTTDANDNETLRRWTSE